MGRFSKIFYGNFFITTLTCVFGCGNAFGIYYSNPEINRLIAEKQDKVAQLETCAKKVKGFKIAGISTIGLTTVGVGANIVMASKESQLSDELERARGELNEKKWNEQQQALEEARRNQNAPSGDGDVHIRLGGNNSSSSDGSVTVTIPVVPGNSGNGNENPDNKSNTNENNGQVHSGNDANTEKPDGGKSGGNGTVTTDNKSNTSDNNGQVHSGNDDNTPVQNDGEQQITPPKNKGDNKSETKPEITVDGWTYEETEMCYNAIRKNASSSDVANGFWSKSLNGKYCEGNGFHNDYHQTKRPNTCSMSGYASMSPGQWKVVLKSGKTISGIAMCSTTVGAMNLELKDDIDTSGEGYNCWCKLTQTNLSECKLHETKFPWMTLTTKYRRSKPGEYDHMIGPVPQKWVDDYEEDYKSGFFVMMPKDFYVTGENQCVWQCAEWCGYELYDYGAKSIRILHGVPDVPEPDQIVSVE